MSMNLCTVSLGAQHSAATARWHQGGEKGRWDDARYSLRRDKMVVVVVVVITLVHRGKKKNTSKR